jgi:hypothetical protein
MYKRMAPEAFRAALERLGLTYREAAVLLGKNKGLFQHWASGRKLIPQLIAAQLKFRVFLVREPLSKMAIPDVAGASYILLGDKRQVTFHHERSMS